jgi:hypothetical protein
VPSRAIFSVPRAFAVSSKSAADACIAAAVKPMANKHFINPLRIRFNKATPYEEFFIYKNYILGKAINA